MLGIQPFLGQLISPYDDPENAQAGCADAVDLSYSFWQRRYGGNRSVIGKTLNLQGHPFPIVGVTPPSFYGVSAGVGSRFAAAVPVCAEPIIAGQYSNITGPNAREGCGWPFSADSSPDGPWRAPARSSNRLHPQRCRRRFLRNSIRTT